MQSNSSSIHALKPPLKWAGGKRWLIERLATYWKGNENRRLVEPFCGGLSVALGLKPKHALLNDVNQSLINFYQQLQQGLTIDIDLVNDETVYYQYRNQFNELNAKQGCKHTAAQLFYFLNRTGYNGLCRFNKSGGYNVPFGRYKQINYKRDFDEYKLVIEKWEFVNRDFQQLALDKNDFIYADPPYDVPFRQYSQNGFEWDDQVRLAEWLSNHSGPVVLSNQATSRVKSLYRELGFKLKFLDAPRSISCKGNQRQKVKEVLALKGF
jgi:DNA adenine methylase